MSAISPPVKDATFTKAAATRLFMARKVLAIALGAELLGTFIFQLLGGSEQTAAYNGLLL